jgi:hypothetical protein
MPLAKGFDQGVQILQTIGSATVEVVSLHLTEVRNLVESIRANPEILGCCCRTEQSLVRNLNQGDRFTDHR